MIRNSPKFSQNICPYFCSGEVGEGMGEVGVQADEIPTHFL